MIAFLKRDNMTRIVKIDKSFAPKVYQKSSLFKNEFYVLVNIEDDVVHYEFSFERSKEDDLESN